MEFRIGDHEDEFGVVDRRYAPHAVGDQPSGMILYWHVDDLEETLERVLGHGAVLLDPVTKRGDTGFVTACVTDPFGNAIGLMTNPHFRASLDAG